MVWFLVAGLFFMPSANKTSRNKVKPWLVHSITFEGNQTFRNIELLAQMNLRPAVFKKRRYSKGRMKSDVQSLSHFYKNQGFLLSEVTATVTQRDTARKKVILHVRVEEGERTIVSSITYTPVTPDSNTRKQLSCRAEGPLVFSGVSKDVNTLQKKRAQKGYINAVVSSEITIDTLAATAQLRFTIKDNPKVVVERIRVTGLEKLKKKIASRELRFKKDDTLTIDAIRKSEQRLYQTGLFSSVYIEPEMDSSEIGLADSVVAVHKDVSVALREADFFRLKLGAGYGNDDGFRGSVETSYYNLFRSGQRGTFKGNLSQRMQQVQTIYSTPWLLGIPLRFDASIYYNHFSDTTKFLGEFWGTLLSVERSLFDLVTLQLWTKFEDVLWIKTEHIPGEFPRENTQSFGTDITFDTRDDLMNPSSGWYSLLKAEVAGLTGINSNQFLKFSADNRLYWKAGFLSCGSGIKFGWVHPYGQSTIVPIQDQFFAGGSRSVRGYRQNFLSTFTEITDSGDTVTRAQSGRVMVTTNLLEIRFPIIWWIHGAMFVDAGILRDRFSGMALSEFIREFAWTAGPGLRVNTPLAIIRFDLGFKLKRKPGELLTQWHLDVGQSF